MSEIIKPTNQSTELAAHNVELGVYRIDQDPNNNTGRVRWLMGRRSTNEAHAGGDLVMPGGTVDFPGDGDGRNILEKTAIREAREELGVEVNEKEITYVSSDFFIIPNGNNPTSVINTVFIAPYESGEPRPVDPDEMTTAEWMTLEEIERHPNAQPWTIENMRRAEQILRRLGRLSMGAISSLD